MGLFFLETLNCPCVWDCQGMNSSPSSSPCQNSTGWDFVGFFRNPSSPGSTSQSLCWNVVQPAGAENSCEAVLCVFGCGTAWRSVTLPPLPSTSPMSHSWVLQSDGPGLEHQCLWFCRVMWVQGSLRLFLKRTYFTVACMLRSPWLQPAMVTACHGYGLKAPERVLKINKTAILPFTIFNNGWWENKNWGKSHYAEVRAKTKVTMVSKMFNVSR